MKTVSTEKDGVKEIYGILKDIRHVGNNMFELIFKDEASVFVFIIGTKQFVWRRGKEIKISTVSMDFKNCVSEVSYCETDNSNPTRLTDPGRLL